FVYSGAVGTTTESQDIIFTVSNNTVEGKSTADFNSFQGQSVTILINLEPNAIAEIKPFWSFWTDYGWLFVLAGLLGGFYLTWSRFGKDDKVISITSYFPPEEMDPAMAGFLINDADDVSDLTSLIAYWG